MVNKNIPDFVKNVQRLKIFRSKKNAMWQKFGKFGINREQVSMDENYRILTLLSNFHL